MSELEVSAIIHGQRFRKDLGNVKALAQSISELGLLHPIVITSDNRLIAGERRIAAFKQLGLTHIPVTIVDIGEIVRGEFAENTQRKDFLPSEAVAIARVLEPAEKEAAKKRQQVSQFPLSARGSAKLAAPELGEARDKAAAYTGVGRTTLSKASEIVSAAEGDPERFGKLVSDMDRTGRVNGPYKRLVVARKAAAIRQEPPPLPGEGPYRVIAADPPWPYELRKEDPSHRATHPYPQMSIAEICALPVGNIAHDDCILWLWTTNHHMREAFGVLDAWGYQHKTILTWVKDRMGTGDWLRGQSEHCLMATRGKPVVELTNQTTVLHGPMRGNSQKPDEFYSFVEKLCPSTRYAELFQRTARAKWDGHGDES
jgi:N6-adenosine-specific RNA methylase IME4